MAAALYGPNWQQYVDDLSDAFFTDYKIEVPVMRQANDTYLRYSINAFNTTQNLDALYDALGEIKKEGKLIVD